MVTATVPTAILPTDIMSTAQVVTAIMPTAILPTDITSTATVVPAIRLLTTLDRAMTEATQASAVALSFPNLFLYNFEVIPDGQWRGWPDVCKRRIKRVCLFFVL